MKKAKVYAEQINSINNGYVTNLIDNEEYSRKVIPIIIELFRDEVDELKKARNVKTDAGLINIFKEQVTKYRSICSKVNLKDGIFRVDNLKTMLQIAWNEDFGNKLYDLINKRL